MSVVERDMAVIVDDIWLETLGLPTRQVEPERAVPIAGDTVDGIIQITGDWLGAVHVRVPRALGVRMAVEMLRLGDVPATDIDIQDAIGEITNMTGGNIKALLPGRCHLSLPTVIAGRGQTTSIPGTEVVARVDFECEGLPAVVTIRSACPVHA